MKVAACIVTYRRLDGLERLLRSFDRLRFEKVDVPDAKIVVVDNDPEGSASEICEKLASELGWPLEYHLEARRGISHARNRAVLCAAALNADFLAFVDDDEVPELFWLDELLFVQRSYVADVVGGPVLPYFPEPVPDWIIKGKLFEQPFERPRYPTGQLLQLTAAGNVLIRTRMFEEMDEYFDERLGLTGGEDTRFFTRAHGAGYRIVWADEAVVYEWTPRSRASASWLLKRAYRLGNSRSLYEMYSRAGALTRAVRFAKGGGRIVQGILLIPGCALLSVVYGRHLLLKPLIYIVRGAGMLTGLIGMRYEEYR